MNKSFKIRYNKLLHVLVHQENNCVPLKLKLQLAYYLQLQDRLEESKKVFESIDEELKNNSHYRVIYDQMKVYFQINDI